MFTGGPYWIEAAGVRLATMPRPDGDELARELARIRSEGVDTLVSLLEPFEALMLGLSREDEVCRGCGIELISFPIKDHGVPAERDATMQLVHRISTQLDDGRAVAIHCYAGIGRSSLIAAAVLTLRGLEVADAFARISKARGIRVPDTPAQAKWVADLFAAQERTKR